MILLDDIPNVIAFVRRAWPVSDKSLEVLSEMLVKQTFPKHYKLVREGTARGFAYFIERGMTRSYWLVDGEEITTSFSSEGSIVFSMDELYYGSASEEYVETIEPATAYSIEVKALLDIVSRNLDLCNWWRVIHQNEYRRLHRSHKERLTLPAKERYAEFATQFPDVCLRARLTDIASYLGITPATLSRVRRAVK